MKSLINKYKTIINYIFSSGISFVLDLALFTLILALIKNHISNAIIIASFTARAISSVVNYLINKYKVFKYNKKENNNDSTIYQYFGLVIINITISSILVSSVYSFTKFNETFIKTIIDGFIFIINFFIQKFFIFNDSSKAKNFTKYILPLISFIAMFIHVNNQGLVFNYEIYEYISMFIILPLLYYLYLKVFKELNSKSFNILSIIFTIFLIFGYSYDNTFTSTLVWKSEIHILVTLIKFIGFYFLIKNILNNIYNFLTTHNFKEKEVKISKVFNKHPFLFSFILLSLVYGIYLIIYYPGIINYDNANQIKEVLGIPTRYLDSIVVLDENITLTNFNPIIHTLLLGNCFKLGLNLGSVNFGLFLYTLIQELVVIFTLSYSLYFLYKEGIKTKYLLIILGLYIFIPFFPYYALTAVKDTLFTAFGLLYIIKIYKLIKYKFNTLDYITSLLILFLMVLICNKAIFLIILSLPFVYFAKKESRKPTIILLFSTLIFLGVYNSTLPYFNIPNTSIREALSIPFQQTARYVSDYPDDVTEEEINTIDVILGYETLASRYVPTLSDNVKNAYNKYATKQDLLKYFGVWAKMFFKHPDSYINATISNTYGYLYPNTYSWYVYTNLNPKLPEAGYDYHFNNLEFGRLFLKGYANVFRFIPIIQFTVSCGFYTWAYIFLAVICFIKDKKKYLILLSPALASIFLCLVGPANTYFRYVLPYAISLPVIIAIIIKEVNPSIINSSKKRKALKIKLKVVQ